VIAIRGVEAADAAAIAAIYAPHVLTGTVSFEIDPPDGRAMRTRMGASEGLYPWLVATNGETGGGVIGYAYATRFRERPAYRYVCETSIYMADVAQGQGAGRLLYEALIDTLRAQGFVHALGAIALPNDASIRLHEAVGFRRAGVYREVGFKHGQWVDVGIWQCELNDTQVPPVEPRKFADVGVVRA
jgi:L-amino acid N-acyltransferase YncA